MDSITDFTLLKNKYQIDILERNVDKLDKYADYLKDLKLLTLL